MLAQKNQFFSVKPKLKESKHADQDNKEEKQENLKDPKNKKKKDNKGLDPDLIELEEKKDKEEGGIEKAKDAKGKLIEGPDIRGLIEEEEKKEKPPLDLNSLLRRWDVKILDLKAENLQKQNITVFLVFKIGEKSKVVEKKRGQQILTDAPIVEDSNSYKYFKTEILKDIEKESQEKVKKFFETEIHASYNMLKQRSLVVEVWEYSRWSLHKFIGIYETKLEDLAGGSISQQVDVRKVGKKQSFLRLFFTCYFQEIWDFRLEFEDLKGLNTIDETRKPIPSFLKLTLIGNSESTLRTMEQPATLNPTWGSIPSFIHFRGTLDDLTDLLLQFTIVQPGALSMMGEGRRSLIALRGVHKFNNLSASVKVKVNKKKQVKIEEENPETEDDLVEEDLNEEEVYTQIEGRINLNLIPRYIQQGELVRYNKSMHHLCVVINRVSHVSAPDDRGLINSFVIVQCGNETKQTRTIKDQMNPDFYEEMVYKIPILQSTSLLDKMNLIQKEGDLKQESLRDELSKRSEIKFQLWVEGNQISCDDNLGFATFNISELAQQSAIEEKEVIDFESKNRVIHKIQSGSFTKNFTSSRFDASRITISFTVFFLPPLPTTIDLRDFAKISGDVYPYEVKDKMKVISNNFQVNKQFILWEQKIKSTFRQWHLKKNEIGNFIKHIWVKDHYNKVHFIPKFLGSFTLQDTSYEPEDLELEDTAIETLQDLAHYTRSIPFVESEYNDVWFAPDFFLSLRRGTVIDHALLLASLFMGVKEKKEIKEKKKGDDDDEDLEDFLLEDRVFVCLGTNAKEELEAWVMVYDKSFEFITFWDVKQNKKWDLKGRVDTEQIQQLKEFLNPNSKKDKKVKPGLFGFGLDKKQREALAKEKLEQKRLEELRKKEEEEQRQKLLKQQQQDLEEVEAQKLKVSKIVSTMNQAPQEKGNKNQGIYSVLESDDWKKQAQVFSVEDIEKGKKRVQFKTSEVQADIQGSIIGAQQSQEPNKNLPPGVSPELAILINDRKTFNKMLNEKKGNKKSFLDAHKEEMIQNLDSGEVTKFKKVEQFEGDDPDSLLDVPFKSLQVIFNQKNVYGNLANQNPLAIFYNLHDPNKWYAYLNTPSQKLGSFFQPSNPYPKMSKAKGDQVLEQIIFDIKDGVSNIRSNEGLQTRWKSLLDPSSKLLKHYIRMLEYQDKEGELDERFSQSHFQNIERLMKVRDPKDKKVMIEKNQEELNFQFEKDMKNLLPKGYNFQCLPMKFLFIEKSQIRALIEERAKSFFLLKKKSIIFGINGKVFRYPNKVNCLRIVIAMYFSNVEGASAETDADKLNKYKGNDQIDEEEEENEDIMDSDENMEDDDQQNLKKKKKK